MKSCFFNKTLAVLIAFVLVAPQAFFIAPQKAYADTTPTGPLDALTSSFRNDVNKIPSFTSSFGQGPGEFSPLYNQKYDAVISAGGTVEEAKAAGTAATGETAEGVASSGCVGSLGAAASAVAAEFSSTNIATPHGGSPAQVYAAAGQCLTSTIQLIQQTISAVSQVSTQAAMAALVFDKYVLQPLAFVLSGRLLKLISAGVIAFVIGKANGTGIPQFVADLQVSLQTVSDARSLAFLNAYMRSSRSPYAGSIVSALRKEYFNKTSLAGFWAQNMDTLRRTSPNPLGFLAGNWQLGGVGAWFALTTQIQNNPYTLYLGAQRQLANLIGPGVGGATGARLNELAYGQGFASWCGASDEFLGTLTTNTAAASNAAAVDQSANDAYDAAYNEAIARGGNPADIAYDDAFAAEKALGKSDSEAYAAAKAARTAAGNISPEAYAKAAGTAAKTAAFARAASLNRANATPEGINPGDPCTNADGTTGTIKTPGSVIVASLNKVLGGEQDNVVRMGNVGPEINNILANIATVIKTVDFAAKILGGPGSGGLFGVNTPSGANSSSLFRQQFGSPGNNLGVTNSNVLAGAAELPTSGADMLKRIAQYEPAVNIIRDAANTASTSVASLADFCTAQQTIASSTLSSTGNPLDLTNLKKFISASTAQVDAARIALATSVAPVLAQTAAASTTIARARAMVQKVQTELKSDAAGAGGAYTADIQALGTMSPTLADVANAQQNTIQAGGQTATANPPGSLAISGGTLIDRMKLIGTNAAALRPACTAPAPTPLSAPAIF